ncbi:hypothetical protein CHGG_03536 [Chaetomium globosum CBS 148.51]|uniref:Nephrocystin 3-like N-terminal domain-containing protein n=1 Tax=Chaetomium globosum (strain ATCC 6205 / CBS 148.51 / DSM 1962 / NBRC 6347 / NRRL 1970) TaxID=306901 RepID=Q2H8B8_CHAGB|nr:uncharacterized protein CHGG_03536 [Chaetomium globosum CBS 148.51]EAQ91601.1 hypothetical protein CHGG_03536 [Chaetomium globosum CBS 148.51]
MAQIEDRDVLERRSRVVEWLVSKDYADEQQLYCDQREPMTCAWFLECAEYNEWLDTKSKVLLCTGGPGAGKTLLTSAVVSNLQELKQQRLPVGSDRPRVGIAYVYFREQTVQSSSEDAFIQSQEGIFRNILGQLLSDLPATEDAMLFLAPSRKLYDTYLLHQGARQPGLSDVVDAFRETAAWYDHVFVVLDALDECPVESRHFLLSLVHAQAKVDARIFATCRTDTTIPQLVLDTCTSRGVRASDADIERYLKARLPELSHVLSRNHHLEPQAVQEITAKSNGSFLLARVYMDILATGTETDSVLKEKVFRFRSGGEDHSALFAAYDGIIDMINGQNSNQDGLTHRALAAVAFSPLALRDLQLRHALALSDEAGRLEEEMSEYLRSKDEFLRKANGRMAASCISYLLFRDFSSGPVMDNRWKEKKALNELVRDNQLLRYASSACPSYLSRANPEVILQLLRRLAEHPQNLRLSFQVHIMARGRLFPKALTITHIVSHMGSPDFIPVLKRAGCLDCRTKDSNGRTALHWAVCRQDGLAEDMAKTLLDFGCEVNAVDKDARSPLSYVAEYGNHELARLLLKRKARTETSGNSLSPLAQACACGHAKVAQVLLEHGAKVNAISGQRRQTPLGAAISGDSEDFCWSNTPRQTQKEALFGTALDAALRNRNRDVKLLLEEYGATQYTKEFEPPPTSLPTSKDPFIWDAIGRYGGHFLAQVAVGNDKKIQQHIDMKVALFKTAIKNKNLTSIRFHTDFSAMAFKALVKQARKDMEREEDIRNGNAPAARSESSRFRTALLGSCLAPILNFFVWSRVRETERRQDNEAHAISSATDKLDLIVSAAVRILSDAIEDGDDAIVQMLSRSWVDALKSMFAEDFNDNMAQDLVTNRAREFEGFFRDGDMDKANLMAKLALELMSAAIQGSKMDDRGKEREKLAIALSDIWSLTLRNVIKNSGGSPFAEEAAYQQLEDFLQRIKKEITQEIKEGNWEYIRRIGPCCVEVLVGLVADNNIRAADIVARILVEGWQFAIDEKMDEIDTILIRELEQEFKAAVRDLAEDSNAGLEMTRPWVMAGALVKVLHAAVRYNSAPIKQKISQLILSNLSALQSSTSPEFIARVRTYLVDIIPVWCEVDENPIYLLESGVAMLLAMHETGYFATYSEEGARRVLANGLCEPSDGLTKLEERVRQVLGDPASRDDAARIKDTIRQLQKHLGAHGDKILPGLRMFPRWHPSCSRSMRGFESVPRPSREKGFALCF